MGIEVKIGEVNYTGNIGSKAMYTLFGTCVSAELPQTFLERLLRQRPSGAKVIKSIDILRGSIYIDNLGKRKFHLDEESVRVLKKLTEKMGLKRKQAARVVESVVQKVEELLGLS